MLYHNGKKSGVFPREAVEFNPKILDALVRDLNFCDRHGFECKIVVPYWSSFQRTVRSSDYKLIDRSDLKNFDFVIDQRKYPVCQSLFNSKYVFGTAGHGYGFYDVACKYCDNTLFYDQRKDIYYCPKCSK